MMENQFNRSPLFKSPSDTTIYSPGLRKVGQDVSAIDRISNFVENMHLESAKSGKAMDAIVAHYSSDSRASQTPATGGDRRCVEHQKQDEPHSSKIADQLLIQAERFKARVEAPKGNHLSLIMPYDYEQLKSKFITSEGLGPIDSEIMFLRNFDQDDEFFHITSQIEPNSKAKIEKGEFVDLERLLPREWVGNRGDDLNRQLFQLIAQGTNSYLDPPMPKAGKINSVRKWDQAFRVYAAIYTHANPSRSSEIWQYVYVIHTAAAANPWDNVYYYDINFRKLMASKPWRSWGKTYTQGWNMAFNNSQTNFLSASNAHGYQSSNSGFKSQSRDWKDDCCWRYNKNKCKRTGSECNYDHRCTYCAGWNHGYHNCRKRQGKQNRRSNNTQHSEINNSPKGDRKT